MNSSRRCSCSCSCAATRGVAGRALGPDMSTARVPYAGVAVPLGTMRPCSLCRAARFGWDALALGGSSERCWQVGRGESRDGCDTLWCTIPWPASLSGSLARSSCTRAKRSSRSDLDSAPGCAIPMSPAGGGPLSVRAEAAPDRPPCDPWPAEKEGMTLPSSLSKTWSEGMGVEPMSVLLSRPELIRRLCARPLCSTASRSGSLARSSCTACSRAAGSGSATAPAAAPAACSALGPEDSAPGRTTLDMGDAAIGGSAGQRGVAAPEGATLPSRRRRTPQLPRVLMPAAAPPMASPGLAA
mmetsp:Transcript_20426/g.51745  ORF Transcript_20426/g.51745 Transcript_20426/m.51745 type:complete len:299 (+) Transcript_20426:3662-4558(+)